MPSMTENISFLYIILTHDDGVTLDQDAIAAELNLSHGAATKRWSRLKEAMVAGRDQGPAAYEYLWVAVKHSTRDKSFNWKKIGGLCNTTAGACAKRFSRLKQAPADGVTAPGFAPAVSKRKRGGADDDAAAPSSKKQAAAADAEEEKHIPSSAVGSDAVDSDAEEVSTPAKSSPKSKATLRPMGMGKTALKTMGKTKAKGKGKSAVKKGESPEVESTTPIGFPRSYYDVLLSNKSKDGGGFADIKRSTRQSKNKGSGGAIGGRGGRLETNSPGKKYHSAVESTTEAEETVTNHHVGTSSTKMDDDTI